MNRLEKIRGGKAVCNLDFGLNTCPMVNEVTKLGDGMVQGNTNRVVANSLILLVCTLPLGNL